MSGSSSEKAAAYRLHSAHCAEMAQRTGDRDGRTSLLLMSIAWLRLAELAEKNGETQQPVAAMAALPQSDPNNYDDKP